MDGTLIVAIYAAVVATLGAGWQIFLWVHGRRHHVSVEARMTVFKMTDGRVLDGVTITAVNTGERRVRVTSVGLEAQDSSGQQIAIAEPPPGAALPGTVDAGDSAFTYILSDELQRAGIDVYRPVTAWVRLADKSAPVKSKGRALMSP